ncbi:MAG: type IV secretion protein IcmB [Alphaproteobacteria bacterium]|nr:type IV secretion protein IcmB [Alphaproteobacteria bacterium]
MMNLLDGVLASFLMISKQPVESFIQLETADDNTSLVAGDGSLVSFVQIHGSRQVIGDAEYQWIIEQASMKLGARFDRPGYALQAYFMRDPHMSGPDLSRAMQSNRVSAQAMDLELDDLLVERQKHLARFLAHEEIFFVLWTRPSAVSKSDLNEALRTRREQKWVTASDSQHPMSSLEPLRVRHKSYVASMLAALEDISIKATLENVHASLNAVRRSIYPLLSNEKWRANLPGDPLLPRAPTSHSDMSDILWPSLRRQICVGDAEVISPTLVRIGDLVWGAVDMTLAPADPSPFPQLLARLIDADVPFHISFLIESAGIQGAGFRTFAASILAWTNDANRQIRESLKALQELAQSDPVVRLRISLSTYAPARDRKLVEMRLAALTQALEAWGYCQASSAGGDPLEMVLSSSLGIACASTAPAAIAPLREVIKLLPWQRASSPFKEGSVVFRTSDGRVWPYQTGSSLCTTWFDLIFAQPGSGKSVLMNALNLGTILSAGNTRLPYMAILDIGPSSAGLISLVRDALPLERRHEAMHFKLKMAPEYAVNPFDTQLGCRYPLPEERSYLSELLTLLCTPPGQKTPYDGMAQLVGLCVDEMYRWRDDKGANSEPRPYLINVEVEVDETLRRYNVHLPVDPYWWDVVDAMYDVGAYHECMLAQRHAVPTLADAVTAARRPQIRALLEETSIGASAESIIHAFDRMIASAVREFPILASITRFDVGTTRVAAVDLQDVAPQGDDSADRQTSVMYMLARHVLVRSWWLGPDSIRMMPEKYRPYHEDRLRDIRECPKRLCYDEFHRTSKTQSVRAQVVRDMREGRKWGVQIVLASQLLDDFSDDMVDMATGVWICGTAVSERAISATAERFGLSDTARWVMRYRLTGPRASGAPVLLLLSTSEGRYEQHLINTLGPVELWALSTSAEDVDLRLRLYEALGAPKARSLLARFFPGGSARQEIRRRVIQRSEKSSGEAASTAVIIHEMTEELIRISRETKDADDGQAA